MFLLRLILGLAVKRRGCILKEALKAGIDTLILNDDEAAQLMASLIDTDQKLAKLIASACIKTSKKDKSSKDNKVNLIDEMIYFGTYHSVCGSFSM